MEETASTAKQYDEPPFTKRILVTGGAGFIGSHVVIYLVKHYPDYYIVNLDSLDYCSCVRNVHSAISSYGSEHETQNSTENAEEEEEEDEVCERLRGSFCEPGDDLSDEYLNTLPKNYKFIHGSITGADLVGYILKTERIDTIMHFAAQSHVDNSFGNSIEFSKTNILGTHVLLEAARLHGISRFIHVSTDEVYGEGRPDSTPMTEDHVLEPTNPYAATKAGAEFLVKTYHRSFGLPTIITRSNNVYGPHQYPEKLIPKFINQILRDRPVTIHGDGKHTRNYLYISDVVAAFDLILHEGKVGEVYNIGGEQELSNKEVTIDLLDIMKPHLVGAEKAKMITHVEDRPFNDHRYIIDATKIRRLGWKEKVPWREGLRKTVKWCCRYGHRFTNVDHALEPHPIAFKKSYKINLP
ncbi:hypothetical protein BBJ29_007927 [Phytophthora kernoviae]|uniref:NAD(P)-binding domain-containing protein n=1 Tax=Phytophthora kernoviae TaxID=325452 RepID=A0A3F2RNK9_9STRA|nr:hypothetical protein BBP00_00005534 [Phytophthora kernoviae]RLN69185.1 hypothetical protein BBJ29_007927 [Phytophthora kernoviae]